MIVGFLKIAATFLPSPHFLFSWWGFLKIDHIFILTHSLLIFSLDFFFDLGHLFSQYFQLRHLHSLSKNITTPLTKLKVHSQLHFLILSNKLYIKYITIKNSPTPTYTHLHNHSLSLYIKLYNKNINIYSIVKRFRVI